MGYCQHWRCPVDDRVYVIGEEPTIAEADTGSNAQQTLTYLGPSLGWALLPVQAELIVTTSGALVLGPYTSRVLLNAAGITPVTLPLVSSWMQAQGPNGLVKNISGFDRSVWIKDYAYSASALTPIVIAAAGSDLIDGQGTFQIVEAGAMIYLFPLTNLTGWMVG
jgi:hypothetical protein